MSKFRTTTNDDQDEQVLTAQMDADSNHDGWEPEDLFDTDVDGEEEHTADHGESVEDSIQLYLHEIGQVPLLTATEEYDLSVQIHAGRDAQQQLDAGHYADRIARAQLEQTAARGVEARRRLIQANLRLVVSVAKKYINSPMAFMDLVQEGNIGLMRAVEKFDHTKGNRFSTYATWWIRQAVSRSIAEQSRVIRLPVHLSESLVQMRRAIYKLEQQLEREPSAQEIAQVMGLSLRKVKRLLQASAQPLSLEQPLNNEQEGRVGEVVADVSVETPMEIATEKMFHQELYAALNNLPDRERKILQLRYGLFDGQRRTLEEVGMTFGITRERTRQIEAEAMRRLRQPQVGQRLQAYLEY